MNIVQFLEQAAQCVRYKKNMDQLLSDQPNEVRQAILSKDPARLRRQISGDEFYANEIDVVRTNC